MIWIRFKKVVLCQSDPHCALFEKYLLVKASIKGLFINKVTQRQNWGDLSGWYANASGLGPRGVSEGREGVKYKSNWSYIIYELSC